MPVFSIAVNLFIFVMPYLVLVKDVIEVDGWVLEVSWVVDGISEESEEVSG